MSVEFPDTRRFSRDLPGLTLADVARAIEEQDEVAQAEWFPTYTYTTTGSRITTVRVIVPTIITMPRWRGYASAGETDRYEWDRFWFALDAHECGHLDLVKQHLGTIDERLVGVSTDDARRIWGDALGALRAASDAYDLETRCGRTQGSVLDVPAATTAA